MQPLKAPELEKALVRSGFTFIRMGAGHAIYKRGTATVSVPRHSFLTPGTFFQILKKAGMDRKSI